jgi:coenzyme Q-binding protein COQ10
MFAVVADVERYPEFVPGWVDARVRHRDGDRLIVEQVVGRGPLRWVLVSEARIRPCETIRIVGLSGPFRHLEVAWRFGADGPSQCTVGLELTADGLASVVGRVLGAVKPGAAENLVDLFARRARAIHDAGGATN